MPQATELQTELARVYASERVQQTADRTLLAVLQCVTSEAEESRVVVETRVQQTHEAESEQVDADGRRKAPNSERRRKRTTEGDKAVASQPPKAGERRVIPEESEAHIPDSPI